MSIFARAYQGHGSWIVAIDIAYHSTGFQKLFWPRNTTSYHFSLWSTQSKNLLTQACEEEMDINFARCYQRIAVKKYNFIKLYKRL